MLAWCAAGSSGIILLNLLVPSLLNFYYWSPNFSRWQRFLAYIVDLHANAVGPFTTRPVTTFLIQSLSAATHLPSWFGFVIVQFLLLTAAAYCLARLSERLESPPLFSAAAFFLSFTVLFSFVTPNDSYDEAAQYLFLFLALRALVSGRDVSFAVLFFLALLARETTALLIPGFLLLGWAGKKSAWKFALPLAAFSFYYFTREAVADPHRFQYWARNLQSVKTAFESLVSLGLALALPMSLYGAARRLGLMRAHTPWLRAFFWSAVLNTPVVFYAAYARESRLFALPLVFLWPLCGAWAQRIFSAKRDNSLVFHFDKKIGTALGIFFVLTAFLYRPAYRFPVGYEILAPSYFLLWLLGNCLKCSPSTESR